ncbi:Abhd12 [Symbiodinium natans]|uniref:Abhd12 protein n=1 Tax=Symbiodinium natans TaxID=878477 RepID=A0A812J663_9DINO|nr:Abhd12 [Symbiodinium natans]
MSFEFPGYGLHMGSASMRPLGRANLRDSAVLGASGRALGSTRQELRAVHVVQNLCTHDSPMFAGNAVLLALHATMNYIANDLKINLSQAAAKFGSMQVVWYGRSIGSGPALRAVHRISKELKQQPGGVVLQCGFANFPEVAGHLFGRVAKRLVNRLWPNEAMMKEIRCPVLLIHGRNDTMIPISQSEKLWEAVNMKAGDDRVRRDVLVAGPGLLNRPVMAIQHLCLRQKKPKFL